MSQSHSKNLQELIRSLDVNPERGLTDQEVTIRLNKYGKNSLTTSLPPVQTAPQITNLHLGAWPLIIGLSFAATFWIELEKILRKNTQLFNSNNISECNWRGLTYAYKIF